MINKITNLPPPDCEKRFKKQNGVNVYQRSPEVQYSETDEEAEEKRLTEKERR